MFKKMIIVVLILFGLFFVIFFFMKGCFIVYFSKSYSEVELIVEQVWKNNMKKVDYVFDLIYFFGFREIVQLSFNCKLKLIIGWIIISSVNLEFLILKGIINENLLIGVVIMWLDQKMGEGNYLLVGYYLRQENLLFGFFLYIKKGV